MLVQNLDPQSKDVINRLFDSGIAQMLQSFGFRNDAMGGTNAMGDWLYELCALANTGGTVTRPSTSSRATVPVGATDTLILVASPTRLGWSVRNSGSKNTYITRGAPATVDTPIILAPGDRHDDQTSWVGTVHAICAPGESSTILVEELS